MRTSRFFLFSFLTLIFLASCNRNYISQRNEELSILSKELESSKNVYVSNSTEVTQESNQSDAFNQTSNNNALQKENTLNEASKSDKKISLKEKIVTKMLNNQIKKIQKLNNNPVEIDDEKGGFQMNQKIKIGLILLLVGIILAVVFDLLGGLVAIVGLVFIVLGLLEM